MDLMVAVFGLVTSIWVDVAIVLTTVGVGPVGKVRFAGKVGLASLGHAIALTLNLLFTGALALFFFSAFLDAGVFLGEEFLSGKIC